VALRNYELQINCFVVWKACQRRVDAFKSDLQTIPVYLHYDWEERSRVHKAISYVLKSLRMVAILGRVKPDVFYVQAPPTIALYVAFLYSRLAHARYVVDAHNSMIYGSFWCRMPFWRLVLRKALLVLVHNDLLRTWRFVKEYRAPFSWIARPRSDLKHTNVRRVSLTTGRGLGW